MRRRSGFHLAQVNIARMRAPLDAPLMADFVAQLETVNALADASPGFVWRLQGEDGDATSVQAFDDPLILINMSVWESVEALHAFVYKSGHRGVLKDRQRWFEAFAAPHMALWWIAAGHIPTPEEAKARLELLARIGPSPDAFTFSKRYPPPGESAALPRLDECPWTG